MGGVVSSNQDLKSGTDVTDLNHQNHLVNSASLFRKLAVGRRTRSNVRDTNRFGNLNFMG